ncbi:hypothetical protein GIB67_000394 [Kingdonia uniflora]|uniref:Uncharacterized protein n=1 Tax=Kingdonia uniflora TaxID=39325 RepID=A0A7J7LGD8_9MAGN|nr:hypothetical protein GIB67_000394 [Kingdonia uniflora]
MCQSPLKHICPSTLMGAPRLPASNVSTDWLGSGPTGSQVQHAQSVLKPNQHVPTQNTSTFSSPGNLVGPGNAGSSQSQLPWPRMTQGNVQKYRTLFVAVGKDRDGKITGEEARNLFLSWNLPRVFKISKGLRTPHSLSRLLLYSDDCLNLEFDNNDGAKKNLSRSYSKNDDSNRKDESNFDNGGNIYPVQSANSFFGTTSSEGGDDGMQQSAKSGSGINYVSRMTVITYLSNQLDSGILAKYGNGTCSNNLASLQGWHYLDPSRRIQGPFSMVQFRKWSTKHFPTNRKIWRTTEKQENSILMTDALDGKFREVLVCSCDVRADTEDGDTSNVGKANQVGLMDSGLETHSSEGSNVGMQLSKKSGMQIGSVSEATTSKSLSNQLDSGKLAKYGNVTYWNNFASLHSWSPKSGAGNNDISGRNLMVFGDGPEGGEGVDEGEIEYKDINNGVEE